MWPPSTRLCILYYENWLMHCKIELFGVKSLLSLVYASTKRYIRLEKWDTLRSLKPIYIMPLFCKGDFNDTANPNEKLGGIPCFSSNLRIF